ncbi:fucose permease [Gottschalkia purinilytica]|uniref:Fucose permease n=1 Tax=Gottschalkia purinilytica TaxID=1503 RepID=A0A0L0W7T2_GOTPU|nr:MFS transporter [Gottschalkia purinilytica]KNF07360.1 fucose permease [Gottschalkia purinilytica]
MIKAVIPAILAWISMIFMGFTDNMKGLFIPSFKSEFNINNGQVGYVIILSTIGYILFQYIGGILIQKLEHKKVYLISILMCIISFISIYFSKTYIVLLIFMFFFNGGIGLISMSANTMLPAIFTNHQAIIMNITHFCYGVGAIIGQRFIGTMMEKGVVWRQFYLMSGVAFAILLAGVVVSKFPDISFEEKKEKLKFENVITNRLTILYIISIGFYVGSEVAISTWLVNLVTETYGFTISKGSLYLSIFFFLFTIGRLLGGFIVDKLGNFKSILASLTVSFILLMIGILGKRELTILISVSGLFFSIVFPTFVATINNVFKTNTSYILGTILMLASTINMIFNFLIGQLNDLIGTYLSFYIVPISILISIIGTIKIDEKLENFDYDTLEIKREE